MITLRLSIVAGCILCGGCGPASVNGPAGRQDPVGKFAISTARSVAGAADTVYKVDTVTGETRRLGPGGWVPVPDAP